MNSDTTKNPLVSIIMPTYNRLAFLDRTIKNMLSQTYKNIELIIINDCSPDNTRSFLEELSKTDSRIKLVNNEVNLKILKSLNKGLGLAKGYYIARADDDDPWINPKKLENQVTFLETHPEYTLVGTGAVVVDENEKELFRYLEPQTDKQIRNRMLLGNPFLHGSVVFKKSILEKTGLYDTNLRDAEDWDMWMRIGKYGKMYNLPSYDILRFYGDRGLSIKNRVNISKTRIQLIKKYKALYPNFFIAHLFNNLQMGYVYLPYAPKFNTFLFKLKRKFLGK